MNIMETNADLTGRESLEHYCAMAMIKANMHNPENGTSPFEICFGQQPRSILDLIAPSQSDLRSLEMGMDTLDAQTVRTIAQRVKDLALWKNETADERARNAVMHQDLTKSRRTATLFDLRVDDEVSYDGLIWSLRTLKGPPDSPVTAEIERDGEVKKVRYAELRPAGTPRAVLRMPIKANPGIGTFVLYDDEDGKIAGGTIIDDHQNDTLTIHVHDPNDTMRSWLPVWEDTDGTIRKARLGNPIDTPVTEVIKADDVIGEGEISPGCFIDDNLKNALRLSGYNIVG
jgi:hypothetical protein